MNRRWFKEFIGPLCAEGCAFASKGCGFAADYGKLPAAITCGRSASPPPQRTPVPSHPLCPMSSVSAWSTAAAVPKYDGARHTRVSRHFCICGADLESWVHCVVHIFYPFWPNWIEGNKGIPACPKYPPLPDLGLAGKPVPSELLYKLVPSTI